MLTINHRCCQMFISLLNNHINQLKIVNHKIINTTKCSTHAPGIDHLDNAIDVMQNDKCIRMATKSDLFTP